MCGNLLHLWSKMTPPGFLSDFKSTVRFDRGEEKTTATRIPFYRLLRYKAGTWSQVDHMCAHRSALKKQITAKSIDLGYRSKSKLKYSKGLKETNKTWDWRNATCLLTVHRWEDRQARQRFRSTCRVSVSCCILPHHQAGVKMKNTIKKKKQETKNFPFNFKAPSASAQGSASNLD